MAHILSISYDANLLLTRELLLVQMGHIVVSAEGFAKAYRACESCESKGDHFDLVILGHSIPHEDKEEIVKRCTKACSCPVLALLRPNEFEVKGAARSVDSNDPAAFMTAVREITS